MAEWKDFSLRNGRKFNILEVMRCLVIAIISLLLPLSAFAQEVSTPQQDLPTVPTVTLEIKIIEILLNDEHREGVDWEAIVSDFHSLQLKKQKNPLWVDKKYTLSVGEVSSEDYVVLLDALDTVGKFVQQDIAQTVLSKDQLKVLNILPDSRTFPKISLNLMWVTSPAGQDKLKIEPVIGLMMKDGNNSALEEILESQTQMNLQDNRTIIIGGLMHEQEVPKLKKFPLLGDLPLVGLFFRKQGKLMQITETIVFVTMHTNSVQMPSLGNE